MRHENTMMGEGQTDASEIVMLNRRVQWTEEGIRVSPDPRHAKEITEELGLEGAARCHTVPEACGQVESLVNGSPRHSLTEVVLLSHEGKHSRSGETRIIKKINEVHEHIKIPYIDKIARCVCCDAATGTSGCRFSQGLEIRWKRCRVFRTKLRMLDPGVRMSFVSTVLTVGRMYTTQMMTRCKPTLSLYI